MKSLAFKLKVPYCFLFNNVNMNPWWVVDGIRRSRSTIEITEIRRLIVVGLYK